MADLDLDAVYREIAAAVDGQNIMGNTLQVAGLDFFPENPDPPVFELADFDINYEKTFGGDADLTINAMLLLSRADDEEGQREAKKLAGTGTATIRGALYAKRNQWSSCSGAYLRKATGPRLYPYGDTLQYYGLQLFIYVYVG